MQFRFEPMFTGSFCALQRLRQQHQRLIDLARPFATLGYKAEIARFVQMCASCYMITQSFPRERKPRPGFPTSREHIPAQDIGRGKPKWKPLLGSQRDQFIQHFQSFSLGTMQQVEKGGYTQSKS